MEAIADLLTRVLAGLPTGRAFIPGVAVLLFATAGAEHALRRNGVVRAGVRILETLLRGTVAALLLAMVFFSALQILLRNLFDSGFLWIDPLLRHLVLLLTFTGAIIATGLKRHVQINVLGRLLKGRAGRFAGAGIALASGLIALALAYASLLLLADELEFGNAVFLNVPSWAIVAIFPVSFLSIAYRFIHLVFRELAGEAPPPGEDATAAGDSSLAGGYPTLKSESSS
jgi:C4-dicarboxylate transporter DctQ subunit